MDKAKAEEILGKIKFYPDDSIDTNFTAYWFKGEKTIALEDVFTADELEVIAWVMRNAEQFTKGK
jgi:hypothetical protein